VRVELQLPELSEFPEGFPEYWLNLLFSGDRPKEYHIYAIVTTYIRLVEAAFREYRTARSLVHDFWNGHEALHFGSALSASAHFEHCLTDMHRAVCCMIRLRGHRDTSQAMKDLIRDKPNFGAKRVADRIRGMRNTIQHLDEQVLDGRVPENTPFAVIATGKETPIPEESGQTLKRINVLRIGSTDITFQELCSWLREMGKYAERLCRFERQC
jgi:hypothetical protein